MRGNSNLNASGIYWLYINPWICSCRNRTSTTAFLLFNRKSNQNKNYTPVLLGMALMTETRRRTMLERSLNYACAGATQEHFWGVCSHAMLKWDTGMCHLPPPGSGVPRGHASWTEALAYSEKVPHLHFQWNKIPAYTTHHPTGQRKRRPRNQGFPSG